jgi:hypothetical protein
MPWRRSRLFLAIFAAALLLFIFSWRLGALLKTVISFYPLHATI